MIIAFNIMKPLCLPALLFLLVSCAIMYRHPNKGPRDFEREKEECEVYARKTLAQRGIPDDCAAVVGKETMRCLETRKGWKRTN